MTPELKFSVVIPAYNRAKQVETAVRSVLAQTYTAFEILVVDDGSTDDTAKVIAAISDVRVHYLYQRNSERGAARNAGKKAASGNFITFLDSDDEFFPNHLETARQFIFSSPGADVYCTSYQMKSPEKITAILMPVDIPRELVHGNFLSCNGVFISKAVAQEFDFSEVRVLSGLEDWEFWLRIAAKKKMLGNRICTSQMNHHDQRSVLQTSTATIEARFDSFYQHIFKNAEMRSFYKGRLRLLKSACETYMALHLAMTKHARSAAVRHLIKGFLLSPSVVFSRRFYATLKRIP